MRTETFPKNPPPKKKGAPATLGTIEPGLVVAQSNSDMNALSTNNWNLYVVRGTAFIATLTADRHQNILITDEFAEELSASVASYATFDQPKPLKGGSVKIEVREAQLYCLMPPHGKAKEVEKLRILATPVTNNQTGFTKTGDPIPEWYEVLKSDLEEQIAPIVAKGEAYATISFHEDRNYTIVKPPTCNVTAYSPIKKTEVLKPAALLVDYVKKGWKNSFGMCVADEKLPEWKRFVAPKGGRR